MKSFLPIDFSLILLEIVYPVTTMESLSQFKDSKSLMIDSTVSFSEGSNFVRVSGKCSSTNRI